MDEINLQDEWGNKNTMVTVLNRKTIGIIMAITLLFVFVQQYNNMKDEDKINLGVEWSIEISRITNIINCSVCAISN